MAVQKGNEIERIFKTYLSSLELDDKLVKFNSFPPQVFKSVFLSVKVVLGCNENSGNGSLFSIRLGGDDILEWFMAQATYLGLNVDILE